MRRPHVYERSAPRAGRAIHPDASADLAPVARAVMAVLPALLLQAEASDADTLARLLGQALSEAEGILRAAGLQTLPVTPA